MRDRDKKKMIFSRRSLMLYTLKIIFFFVIVGRFFFLQLVRGKKYKMLSENNRVRTVVERAIRGKIFDCHGATLAINKIAYTIVVQSRKEAEVADIVCEISKLLNRKLNYVVSDGITYGQYQYVGMFIIKQTLDYEEIAKISSSVDIFSKIDIGIFLRRHYKFGEILGHITGYVAQILNISHRDDSEMQNRNYTNLREIGKSGVERSCNDILSGEESIKKIEVNARGTFVRELEILTGYSGKNITLTIDVTLQEHICNIMNDVTGVMVVMSIPSGNILAMRSTPSYDPNIFTSGSIAKNVWQDIVSNPRLPLIDKAVSKTYPPGSTFKLMVALAILKSGIDPNEEVFCSGEYNIEHRTLHCWKEHGHGYVNLKKAIASSCGVYFYTQGLKIGINNISSVAKEFGLGAKTNIQLPFERAGIVPNKTWKRQIMKQAWYKGDTLNASIGQGYVLATPIQLCTMVARIATGKMVKPTILQHISDMNDIDGVYDNQPVYNDQSDKILGIKPEYLTIVRKAMSEMFTSSDGTGRYSGLSQFGFAGKTGTAQVVSQLKTTNEIDRAHGLFVGFAPFDDPKYAVAVIVEHGGWGGQVTLPLVKELCKVVRW